MSNSSLPAGLRLAPTTPTALAQLFTPEALAFLAELQRSFNPRRRELLAERQRRQQRLDAGALPASVNAPGDWQVPPPPPALLRRQVEITGPIDAKMIINALNSGADVFMADCEDATSPSWQNQVEGQLNLQQAVRGALRHEAGGKQYRLNDSTATLLLRPRGWHLEEAHLLIDDQPISASLFDFGLYFFHNAQALIARGAGPYFYLPKLQGAAEAGLWNDVFVRAQALLGLPRGSIRATMLIEHVLAAFELEAMLYALREHSAGLNAGRWDYIFSIIKTFRADQALLLPDRAEVSMQVPFMQAYCRKLVQTCHRHGAQAIGGMAAFIPSRHDPEINAVALAKVRADKEREARLGFDGSWVAHPDLVPVAREVFERRLGQQPHQLQVLPEGEVPDQALLDFAVPGGRISAAGLRTNLEVAIRYTGAWLDGLGAVAIHHLMEDAATAEISRAQLWQWLHHGARLEDGRPVDAALIEACLDEELARLLSLPAAPGQARFREAAALLRELILAPACPDFLTLPAYERLIAGDPDLKAAELSTSVSPDSDAALASPEPA